MRDPVAARLFAAQLPSLIAAADAAKTYRLRMWSVGCATGEEAYSITALAFDALIAAGKASVSGQGITLLPPWRIEVIGSDISRRTLTKARSGVYDTGPLSSVREESPVISRHFLSVPSTGKRPSTSRSASADLKSVTRFEHFNIMAGPAPSEPFDAVFCRNVLIYFSDLCPAPRPGHAVPRRTGKGLSRARFDRYGFRRCCLRNDLGTGCSHLSPEARQWLRL